MGEMWPGGDVGWKKQQQQRDAGDSALVVVESRNIGRKQGGGGRQFSYQQQPAGSRKLVVGMKLTAACREMLTWVLTKLAQPGDHILVVHVSAFSALRAASRKEPPGANGTHGDEDDDDDQQQQQELGKSLEGLLSVYQGLCILKQVKLQLEIIRGSKAKKALVEFAAKQDASKLVLGSCNKHFIIGRSTSLGMYCLKRLPCTCTVVIVEHGLVVFDKPGSLKNEDQPRSGTMLKVWGQNMRRRKVVRASARDILISDHVSHRIDLVPSALQNNDEDGDSSSSPTSVLIPLNPQQETVVTSSPTAAAGVPGSPVEEFRISFSRRNVKQGGGVMQSKESISFLKKQLGFLLAADQLHNDHNNNNSNKPAVFSQLAALPHQRDLTSFSLDFLKKHMIAGRDGSCSGFTSPATAAIAGASAPRTEKSSSWLTPGWPLMHNAIGFDRKPIVNLPMVTTTTPGVIDRNLSVVNWALQLPGLRSRPNNTNMQLNSINLGNFAVAASPSLERNKIVSSSSSSALAQQVERLCLDRPCTRFSYHQLKAATSDFSPGNIIGRGGASQVYKGKMQNGKLVAVKCLNQGAGRQAEEELLTDIQITCNLSHVNIVTLLGYCADTPHMALVYNYVPQGSLDDHLHRGGEEQVLAWAVRYRVALGVAKALDYLQNGCRHPVIHRDVKASNILLTENFDPRLSDFGLAKWGPTNASHIPCDDVFGTFGYLAPEYFMYGKVNNKTDVYSFGVVLLELITGRTPIDNSKPKGQENLVTWARPLLEERNLEKLVDPQLQMDILYDLNEMESTILAAALCIQESARRRPSMNRVLKILHGDRSEDISIFQRHDALLSLDFDEVGCTLSDKGGDRERQTYMALAMLGVDEDVTSQSSTDSTHSNVFLEKYLEGRFSRSFSFDD